MRDDSPHVTVLLHEAVEALAIRPDGIYVDCTFGRGGHSRAMLEKLGERGRLIAIDRDAAAIAANRISDKRFVLVHAAMSHLADILARQKVAEVDGVLMDLGVSSPQLDEAERGFSFRFDGPLDMRMDTTCGITAAEWINTAEEQDMAEVIKGYGEERFAKQIARAIVAARRDRGIRTTRQLAELVAQTVRTRESGQHPATRTFQAIRIFVNQELEEIGNVLPQAVNALRTGGRLVVISFHSLEDRIVKRFMKRASQADDLPKNLPIRAGEIDNATLRLIGRAVKPAPEDIALNPRARSAVMRVAERTAVAARSGT